MGRLIKGIVFLLILAAIAVIGYAYFGDLTPERETVTQPVELDEG